MTDRRWNDGPSHLFVGGHLEKIGQRGVGGIGTDTIMVHREYDIPSSGSRSIFTDRTEDATFIICESHGMRSDNLNVINPST